MLPNSILIKFILLGCLLLPPAATAAQPPVAPTIPFIGEQWFSITMGDARTGFARTAIARAGQGYAVTAENSARMVVLGFSREAWAKESFQVGSDLSLKSFVVEQMIDGTYSLVKGERTAKGLRVTVESAGKTREKLLKPKERVFIGPLLNVYPLIHGPVPGKKYRLQVIDTEEVKLKEVTVTVVERGIFEGLETIHLRNDLYPLVDNDIWIDPAGKTITESIRDGLVVTAAESEENSRQFLLRSAIARHGLVVPFTTVVTDRPVARPREVQVLTVELSGATERLPVVTDERQTVTRLEDGRVIVTVKKLHLAPPDPSPVAVTPAGHGQEELLALKNGIVGDASGTVAILEKLAVWVSGSIADSPGDQLTPLETARAKKGTALSRVGLFVELANVAGIPTRAVAGLAYVAGSGFIYQSWAESCAGAWIAVDPLAGILPADATHVKLVEGITPAALAPLGATVGTLAVKVLEERY